VTLTESLSNFKGLLLETQEPWRTPAAAAAAKIDAKINKHILTVEPLCSDAARLNPNYEPEELFGAKGPERFDGQLVETMKHEPPVTTTPIGGSNDPALLFHERRGRSSTSAPFPTSRAIGPLYRRQPRAERNYSGKRN
jgi:hypothetical protein